MDIGDGENKQQLVKSQVMISQEYRKTNKYWMRYVGQVWKSGQIFQVS